MAKRKRKKATSKTTETKQPEPAKVDPEVSRLLEENAALKANAKKPAGIPNAKERTLVGEQPRAEAKMKGHAKTATGKARDAMTDAEVVSVEREIRRYVKKGGMRRDPITGKLEKIEPGFRKNLSEDKKNYAQILLDRMGRDKPEWDESILVPGFSDTLKGAKSVV